MVDFRPQKHGLGLLLPGRGWVALPVSCWPLKCSQELGRAENTCAGPARADPHNSPAQARGRPPHRASWIIERVGVVHAGECRVRQTARQSRQYQCISRQLQQHLVIGQVQQALCWTETANRGHRLSCQHRVGAETPHCAAVVHHRLPVFGIEAAQLAGVLPETPGQKAI